MKLKIHHCLHTGKKLLHPGPFDNFGKGGVSTASFMLHAVGGVGGAESWQAAPANKALA